MDASWAQLLLYANLVANVALLSGALWCIAFPSRRIYPMARPDGWYYAMWTWQAQRNGTSRWVRDRA